MRIRAILILFIFFSFIYIPAFAQTNTAEEDEFLAYEKEFEQNKSQEIYDPFEKVNRKIFTFNDYADRYFLEPIATGYRKFVPKPIRKSIRNFGVNITLPMSVVNSFAQGKVDNALATFSTFLINSTLGVGGLFNVAGNKNIKYNHEDFGQTLAFYGTSTGPYLMIPLFGPSSIRDGSGMLVDRGIDPLSFNLLQVGGKELVASEYLLSANAVSAVDNRESFLDSLKDLRKDSFDLYATVRTIYFQQRNEKIKN